VTYDPVATFAINLRERREGLGWSQERLAEEAHLDRTYVGAVERQERNITLRSAQRIASALDSALPDLLIPRG
jgi:transcriptional regulator with XRE-family HTH domain